MDFNECEFWDSKKFWQSEIPIFSPCLRNSILRWIPSIFFIFGFVCQVNQYLKKYEDEKVNWIYHVKKLIIILLFVGSITELGYFNNFDENLLFTLKTSSTSLEAITYVFAFLLFVNPRNKLRTSCLLLVYSFILVITTAFRVYSSIAEYYHYRDTEFDVEKTDKSYLIYQIVYLSFILLFFIFNCCKDSKLPTDSIRCPIYYSSFLSRATFSWLNSTIWRGFRNPIQQQDLWDLHYSNTTNYLYNKFNRFYRKKLEKKITEAEGSPKLNESADLDSSKINGSKDLNGNLVDDKSVAKIEPNGVKAPQTNGINQKSNESKPIESESPYKNLLNKPPNVNLVGPLMKTFWKEFIAVALFRLFALCIQFVNPIILDYLLTYINSKGTPKWEGVVYGLGMACVMLSFSLANNQYEWRINILGMKIRSVLTMAIYKKTLILSSTGRRIYATGEIVNLMGTDCERIFEFITMVNQFWACCFQILVSLLMIYYKLKLGFLGAIGVLIIVIPWNTYVTRKLKRFQSIEMGYKDDRVNMLTEILNGIKCLKLYGWEHSFKNLLFKIREDELTYLRKKLVMQISMIQSYTLVPFLIIFFCLLLHVLIYPDEVLDANKAFVTISLVNILKTPLGLLPFVVSNGVMSKIAVTRINKFLSEDEINPESVERTNNANTKDALLVKKASFIWDIYSDTKPVLKNINVKIRRKQLVAVVGQVAAGKSSFLSALLGEMHRIKGEVAINGSVAYVSQQAWILNKTLKENIVFGNEFDQNKFSEILSKCQLIPDLKLLADGENTEIGEKGINLSGGQKQRVNIARAVYADKDIYLFDDPLSALDSNVGKEVFDQVIGPNGILKNKTRILVTHKVSLLPKVDRIIVLKNGEISEVGSYGELMRTKGDFAEFILQHLENEEFDLDNIDNQEYQDMQQIHQQIRSTLNLPSMQQSTLSGSKPGSLHSSFRRRKSVSSTKSACMSCKNQTQTCYYCERNRQRSESLSSRKSFKRNSLASLNKSFDEFDRESILNDDQDEFVEEQNQSKQELVKAETVKSGGVSSRTYNDYLKQFNRFAFVIVILFYTTAYVFNYNASIWLSNWADDSKDVEKAKSESNRNYRIGIYLVYGLGESLFVLFSMIVLSRGCLKAAQNIHNTMLTNISCSPMHYFDSTPIGRILNRFAKDMDILNYAVWMNLRSFFNSLLKSLTSFLIISTQAPTIMLFMLPLFICYYLFQLVYIRTKRQLVRINLASKSPIYSIYQETINGSSSIRAFNLEDRFCNSCAEKIDINSTSFLPTVAVTRWLTMRLELLGNLIVCTGRKKYVPTRFWPSDSVICTHLVRK